MSLCYLVDFLRRKALLNNLQFGAVYMQKAFLSTSSFSSSTQETPSEQKATKLLDRYATSTPKPSASASEHQDVIEALRQASPTGKLLDAFSTPGPQVQAAQPLLTLPAQSQQGTSSQSLPPPEQDMVRLIVHAVNRCKPMVNVLRSTRGHKITYVPVTLAPAQQRSYAIRWIVQGAWNRYRRIKTDRIKSRDFQRARPKFHECLALEILLAYQGRGFAFQKREELHKLVLDNKANVLAKWW